MAPHGLKKRENGRRRNMVTEEDIKKPTDIQLEMYRRWNIGCP
jgi:hypothetical protein